MNLNEILIHAIAYHEAAHAAFAHILSIEIVKLTINSDESFAGGQENRGTFLSIYLLSSRNSGASMISFVNRAAQTTSDNSSTTSRALYWKGETRKRPSSAMRKKSGDILKFLH